LFLYGLNAGELWRNEGLRARIAQEMLAGGEWIVPQLYGQPIFTKPPFMYWAICLASWPFGEVTAVTARLPSALAGFGTVLLFWWYFRRTLGERAGMLAALFVPLMIFWLEKAPSAEIDALQVFWVAGSILFFLRATETDDEGQGVWWLLAGLCIAGGTLTKWTAPVFFYGTALPLLWFQGRVRVLWGRGHLLMTGLVVLIVGGWIAAAIGRTSAAMFWDAIVAEAGPRLLPSENPKPYPWLETLFHPLVVLAAGLPGSLLILRNEPVGYRHHSVPVGYRHHNSNGGERLRLALHCWLWPNLLFWSLHPDHTLRNRAPLFPAIAGLAVFGWLAWERRAAGAKWFFQPRRWLIGFLIVWTTLKVVHVEVVVPGRTAERRTAEKAAQLARWLPAGAVLVLFRIKDECLFFYLDRPVLRLAGPGNLPDALAPVFCMLTEEEWRHWDHARPAQEVTRLEDGQGDAIYLVAMERSVGENDTRNTDAVLAER